MELLGASFLVLFLPVVSLRFIGTQCGDKVCGKHSICDDENEQEGTEPKCACASGYIGLPHEACFKTCSLDNDCPGRQNECIFHDPYFPQIANVSFFVYNYPYSHHRCRYDCEEDIDCGKNAVCQTQNQKDGEKSLKVCSCLKGFSGLPYLQCFDPSPTPIGRDDIDPIVKCPILEKTEGIKISCLDRDGTEHDCSTGGIEGTSAMFSCKTDYVPANYKMKYSRMKCSATGKWSQYKMFHCNKSVKLRYVKTYSKFDPIDYY